MIESLESKYSDTEMGKQLNPVQMLVIYGNTDSADVPRAAAYMESHQIIKGKLTEGVPVDQTTIHKLMESFSKTSKKEKQKYKTFDLSDERLLWFRISQTLESVDLIWFNPPKRRKVYFESKKLKEGIMGVPGMIYCVKGGECTIYSFRGKEKPSVKTKLCAAPFPNTQGGGSVCWGNTKLPKNRSGSIIEEMNRWENRYWNSDFAGEGNIRDMGSLGKVYSELMKNLKPFPQNLLKEGKTTLQKLIGK